MSRLNWLLSRLRRTLWIRVSLYALLGVVVALLASLSSRFLDGWSPFDISTDAIDSLLTIIATSMLAVTTFSVGALTAAYSAATANATPRATTLLTENEIVQRSLATFMGSFLFSIVGLIALKVSIYGAEGRVVLFLVTMGVIVLIVVALLRWINQLTKLGRVGHTIDLVEDATHAAMKDRIALPFLGGRVLTRRGEGAPVFSTRIGYVQFIDTEELSKLCAPDGLRIDVQVLPGSFVHESTALATVSSAVPDDTVDTIRSCFTIGVSRTFDQDPRFGLIVLGEIALRGLSPAVNDPGTAIDVIGRQTRLLSYWGNRWAEAEATPPHYEQLRVPPLAYDDLLEDAFNLIGRDAAGQVDVMLRLVKVLQALSDTGPAPFRAAVRRQLEIAVGRAGQKLQAEDDRRRLEAVAGTLCASRPN
jgi:uncharacterized membrane protein